MSLISLKEEKGSALVIVMVIMVVLMLLSTVFLLAMASEGKQALKHDHKTQAYYNARSGAGAALSWLEAEGYALEGTTYLFGDLDNLEAADSAPAQGAPILVTLEPQAGGKEITVTATGNFHDSTEQVTLTLALEGEQPGGELPPFDMALFAMASTPDRAAIAMSGSTTIRGPVGTNTTGDDSIQFGWSTYIYNGTLSVGPTSDPYNVIQTEKKVRNDQSPNPDPNLDPWDQVEAPWLNVPGGFETLPAVRTYPDPVFPDFPTDLPPRPDFTTPWVEGEYYEINQDGRYNLIEVTANRTLHIDLRGGERIIAVNRLYIPQGHIVLKNIGKNGRLVLYVRDSITLGGSSTVNEGGQIQHVMLYYKGAGQPDIGGDTRFVGNLFAERAPIYIGGSNGVTGHIITGGSEVIISGDATLHTRVLYAPRAHVYIGGSGKIKGTVIANTFEATGGSDPAIEYSPIDPDTFPFEIFPGGMGGGSYPPSGGSWVIKSWQ